MRAEGVDSIGEETEGVENIVGHYRLHYIELELAVFYTHSDNQVIADNLIAGLVHNLGDNRVDLAGHDRGAGLTGRQDDFGKAGPGTGSHKTEVIANLYQRKSSDAEAGRQICKNVSIAGSVYQIFCGGKAFVRDHGQLLGYLPNVLRTGVKAGTDSGGTHVDGVEQLAAAANTLHAAAYSGSKGMKFLTESNWYGILQVSAPHLQNIGKFIALVVE